MAVVQVQAARAEDPGGEVQLTAPVGDDLAAEEALRPSVHLPGHLLRRLQEHFIAGERQLQVPLVVERHRLDLTQRVLAVEHPTVGARQQSVGDVANALLERSMGLSPGPGALDPLALEVFGDGAAGEAARSRVGDRDPGPRDRRIRV